MLTVLSYSAASAIAGNTFLRSLAGAGFPLFSTYMYEGMGIQWASTLLGCVAAALVPIPVLFYLYGHKLRAKSSFAPTPPPMIVAGAGDDAALEKESSSTGGSGHLNGLADASAVPRKTEESRGNGV